MKEKKSRVVDMSTYELKETPPIKPRSDGGYRVKTYKSRRPATQYSSQPPILTEEAEDLTLRGTLFSTIVFVGGAIVLWTGLLFFLFLFIY